MKKLICIILGFIIGSTALTASAQIRVLTAPQGGTGIGSVTAGDVGLCLTVGSDTPFTYVLATCGTGGGGGGGTWSTTTSQVAGQLINYPNNTDDVVVIGSNASTTAEFWFDPNTTLAKFSASLWVTSSTTLSNFTFLNATGTQIRLDDGANTLPAFSFSADPDTGIYRGGTNVLSLAAGGTSVSLSGSAFRPNTDATTMDLGTPSLRWKSLNAVAGTTTSLFSSTLTGNTLGIGQTATTTIDSSGNLSIGGTTFTFAGDAFDELVGDGLDISSGDLIFDCSDVAGTGITCSGEDITATLGTSIDISAETNLTAGDNLTLTDDDLDLDTTITGLTKITTQYSSTTDYASFLTASTTNLILGGVSGNSWDDYCVTITGSSGLCDGSDATGSGSAFAWTPTSWGVSTSTTLGFLQGFLSTASSTVDSTLRVTGNTTIGGALNLPTSGFLGFTGTTVADATNYSLFGNATLTLLNARSGGSIGFRINNTDVANFSTTGGYAFGSTYYNLDPGTNNMNLEGSLGIGISVPTEKLDVVGNLKVSGNSTTTNATTTDLHVSSDFNFGGVAGNSWDDFCVSITGSASLCDGADATGAGGGEFPFTTTTFSGTTVNATGTPIWFTATTPYSIIASSTLTSATTTTGALQAGSTAIGNNVARFSPLTGFDPSNSESVGGMVGFDCTADEICLRMYGNHTGSARYLSIVQDNASYSGQPFHLRNDGTDTALNILCTQPQSKGCAKLTVQSGADADASAISFQIDDNDAQGIFGLVGPGHTGKLLNFRIATTTEVLTLSGSTGFLGLGTTTPGWPLQIATTSASSTNKPQLALTDPGAGTNLKHWTFRSSGGNLYVASSSDLYATSTTPSITINGSTNAVTFGNSLATCIALTGSSALCDGDDASGGAGGSSNSKFATTSIDTLAIYNVGLGAIGAGTTTPTYGLTIASSTKAQLSLSEGAGVAQWVQRNAGGNLYFATTTVAGDATTTLSALTILGSSGNVGIGTTSPMSALSIESPGATQINVCNGIGTACLRMGFTSAGNQAGVFGTANNAGFFFQTNAQNRMAIRNNGHIGIGTTTPNWPLQVSSSTGSQLTLSDPGLTTFDHWSFRNAGGKLYLATSSPTTFSTSTTPTFTIDSTNTVTFGNSLATCIALTGSAGLCDGDDGTGAGGSANSKWATTTADLLSIIPSNAFKVGIGTTTPFSTLSVSTTSANALNLPLFTVASSTHQTLFQVLSGGGVKIGAGTPLISFDGTNGSTTLQKFTFTIATGTAATTTSLHVSGNATGIAYDKPTIHASSTLDYDGNYSSTGTTTYNMWNPSRPARLTSLYCKTDVGTVWYEVGTGSATSTVQCTTSGAESTVTVDFSARANVYEALGYQASNPNRITVTPTFIFKAN